MTTKSPLADEHSPPSNLDINKHRSSRNHVVPDNTATRTGPISEGSEKAASPSTDAEMLLRALRNVVIPLVRPADGVEYHHDVNKIALGPDGEEFVRALHKFMESFLHSQRSPVGGIQIDVSEQKPDVASPDDYDNSDKYEDTPELGLIQEAEPPVDSPSLDDHNSTSENDARNWEAEPMVLVSDNILPESEMSHDQEGVQSVEESPTLLHASRSTIRNMISNEHSVDFGHTFEQRRLRFFEMLLKALREHVFNTMPIRLLHFKPHASKLQITLIERGEIYTRIASSLENGINFADVWQDITALKGNDNGLSSKRVVEFAIKKLISKYSGYAILSHTWIRGPSGEVIYGDWAGGEFDPQKPGYQKLANFCKTAWEDHGVAFGWMDTVCINKESSTELDESIRSMYKWYSRADVCITYLEETATLEDMANDAWFTRGWTLQELLAPHRIRFYNTYWNILGDFSKTDGKNSIILKRIEQATTITETELTQSITWVPISRRMQMAAKRQVTREEDTAYSLMGIFDVSIATAYGEGAERAFSRLLQEILSSSQYGVVDIFNCAGFYGSRISNLLPPNLKGYLPRSSNRELKNIGQRPIEPFLLTHLGLRVTVVLMPAISNQNSTTQYDSIGDYHATADISILPSFFGWRRNRAKGSYNVLDTRISKDDGWNSEHKRYQLTLGILNVGSGDNSQILVQKYCLAVALEYRTGSPRKIGTEAPIIFALDKRRVSDGGRSADYNAQDDCYHIERSELASHGMKLVTLYL